MGGAVAGQGMRQGVEGGCSRGWARSSDPEGHGAVADKWKCITVKGYGR